ncbi:hypothetical protein FN846DRAFT_339298 [Sphaerosporella brunnea]|uniref:Uncharacterized protein n=1 Tax=Sphaerosporella brunnea TaxID=1250544 RepID=A0A5J5EK36_9PEZI|nr:hypothetical protein FN846DRAFT_339298 [Sphaerosporella brunnea]
MATMKMQLWAVLLLVASVVAGPVPMSIRSPCPTPSPIPSPTVSTLVPLNVVEILRRQVASSTISDATVIGDPATVVQFTEESQALMEAVETPIPLESPVNGPVSELADVGDSAIHVETSDAAATHNATETLDITGPVTTMIGGSEAVDVTNTVEAMFNDSALFHRLSQSDVDAVDICKSYAFDTSQVNWHLANTEAWQRSYALENQHRAIFKLRGLVGTIAFDFLGISGFKCAIGTSHLCTIDCPTVVRSVADLEVARHVYFTLASASHLVTVMEILDKALGNAQANVQGMVQKMSLDFFYNRPTKGESERARMWQFFVQLSIWSVQTALNSIVPLIPWSDAQDWLLYKFSEASGISYDQTGRLDKFGDFGFDRWRGEVLENALGELVNLEEGWFISPAHGGHFKYNPTAATLEDWFRVNARKDRQWTRYIYGEQVPMSVEAVDRRLWTPGEGASRAPDGWFPEFRQRWRTEGFSSAIRQSASDLEELAMGTVENIQGRWWWLKNAAHRQAVEKVPWLGRILGEPDTTSKSWIDAQRNGRPDSRLLPGDEIVSWGPPSDWHPRDRWRTEWGESAVRLVDEIWGHRVAAPFDWMKFPIATTSIGATNLTLKLDKYRAGMARLYPIGANLLLPMYLREFADMFTFAGTDKKHDHNSAQLAYMVQESGRYARRLIRENVNNMFSSSDVGEEGRHQTSFTFLL